MGTGEQGVKLSTCNNSIMLNREYFKKIYKKMQGYVEIRLITDDYVKNYFFKDYNEIFKKDWPENKNIYVGMFTRSYKRGTSESAHKTKVLWADYDNFSLNDIKY